MKENEGELGSLCVEKPESKEMGQKEYVGEDKCNCIKSSKIILSLREKISNDIASDNPEKTFQWISCYNAYLSSELNRHTCGVCSCRK